MAGVAQDYCVRATSIDARKFGFGTTVVRDAVRAVDPDRFEVVFSELERWGCKVATTDEILA